MAERVPTTCDQCGQTDTDPKVHIADGATKHHDCLSYTEKEMVAGSSDVAAKIIAACEGGKRGEKLLAHIESLHK
jgi:hypothetical protein